MQILHRVDKLHKYEKYLRQIKHSMSGGQQGELPQELTDGITDPANIQTIKSLKMQSIGVGMGEKGTTIVGAFIPRQAQTTNLPSNNILNISVSSVKNSANNNPPILPSN
jgi:hypothetical protein